MREWLKGGVIPPTPELIADEHDRAGVILAFPRDRRARRQDFGPKRVLGLRL